MFLELNNILDTSPSQVLDGKSILITESGTDAGFLLHHLISTYVRGGHTVCLLGLAQSFNHYNSVGNKIGVNLKKYRDDGKLVFIEGMKMICEEITDGNEIIGDSTEENARCVVNKSNLKPVFELVRSSLNSITDWASHNKLVLIDDLGMLLSLGNSIKDIIDLMQALRVLTCHQENMKCCLATLIHCDRDVEDDEADLLIRHLQHQSDLILSVEGLRTGYCRDVHGMLTVTKRKPCQPAPSNPSTRVMQFKVTDKNVNLFAAGTSAAVL